MRANGKVASTHMTNRINKTLPETITDILTCNGAIVEHKEDGCLEVIAPTDVSKVLSIPEYARLSFSYNETSDEAIYASYDSDLFSSIARLFADRGRFSIVGFEPYIPNIEKLSKVIPEKIALGNATFRLNRTEVKDISYLLLYFKYVALSDERHEGIIPLLINELNLSTTSFDHGITEFKEVVEEPDDIERHDKGKVLRSACSATARIVEGRLKEFIKSLERRLNRDIKRVYEYYETLKEETRRTIKRKALVNEPDDINSIKTLEQDLVERERLIEKQIEDRTIKGDGIDRLINKLDAVEAEKEWKIKDLVAKYALSIQIEPVSAIRIETRSLLSWIDIKRRLSSRQFPVTFNPITRQIDALPCESCFNPKKPYYICDDRLHIVCADCFIRCHDCGKYYCNSCCNNVCPKCRRGRKA